MDPYPGGPKTCGSCGSGSRISPTTTTKYAKEQIRQERMYKGHLNVMKAESVLDIIQVVAV
jgi:hypothetical protein